MRAQPDPRLEEQDRDGGARVGRVTRGPVGGAAHRHPAILDREQLEVFDKDEGEVFGAERQQARGVGEQQTDRQHGLYLICMRPSLAGG